MERMRTGRITRAAIFAVCVLTALFGLYHGKGLGFGSGLWGSGGKAVGDGNSVADDRIFGSENEAAGNIFSCGSRQPLSGNIRLAGSTSMEKLAEGLAEGFMEKYPEVNVTVEFVGSSAGIQAVLSGTADIGNSSRDLKEAEKAKGAVEHIVGIDGIAVCANPAGGVSSLTREQLTAIYTGAVTSWSQVGGMEFPVVVVGQQAGSGTREAFERLLGVEDACIYANELGSCGAVLAKVASTPGAVGYLSLEVVDESIVVLALDEVLPTAESIKTGAYFLSRPFLMVTKGEIDQQSQLVQAWFAYVLGEEGRTVVERLGAVTTDSR
ncbi:MAG: phosphate ABC transporter substrate-binding protein [Firmicutes bacterium]|nr:phosphate ABC transporter substrate-binding protein [Bacillota bacterium]